jgi:hypothetical protein
MTRQTAKNRINKILRETTNGLHKDEAWIPVYAAWKALDDAGFVVNVLKSDYQQNYEGDLVSKTWLFEVEFNGKKPFSGILTAHGAGSVSYPLERYDISAYVS